MSLREYANPLILGKVTGEATTVGLYSMADDLAHLPGTKISPVINMLTAPAMAELQRDVDAMRAAFYRAVRLATAIVAPMSAGIALVAEDMVAVLLGPKWLPAVPLLRFISLYAAVRGIDVLLPSILLARRREGFLLRYCFALLILMPSAAVLGAIWDGAVGMIVFYTPAYFAVMIFLAKEAMAEIGGGFAELLRQIWPVLAATAAMAATVFLVEEAALTGLADAPFIRLVCLSLIGALTYGAVLFVIGSPVIGEAAEVAGWILRRHKAV